MLNSFEELCITLAAAGNSVARELNPHGGAYIVIHRPTVSFYQNIYIYIYIYIYIVQSADTVEYIWYFSAKGSDPTNECAEFDTKQSDDELQIMLEFWRMHNTHSLLSLPDPVWLGVVSPGRVLYKGHIEENYVFMLNWIHWNGTVLTFKQYTELFQIELFWDLNMCKPKTILIVNWIVRNAA